MADTTYDPYKEAAEKAFVGTGAGLLGLAGVSVGGEMVGNVLKDTRFKQRAIDQFDNYLDGFYRRGKLPPALFSVKKGALAFQEGAKGMSNLIADASSYGRGMAYRSTGLTLSSRNLFRGYLNEIDNERARVQKELKKLIPGSKKYQNTFREGNRNVNLIARKMHAKVTNDYANELLLDPKEARKHKSRSKYISGDWRKQKKSRVPFVEKTSTTAAVKSLGAKEVSVLKNIWDIQPNAKGKVALDGWAKYRNVPGLQDVMHGIKFHRPFYHTVLALNRDPTYDKFLQAAYDNKLMSGSGKDVYLLDPRKGRRRIAISFNPSMKPNYDWGGYNGMAIFDERTKKIKLVASDKRDLFKFNLGKQVINYTDPLEIDPSSDAFTKQANKYFSKETADKNIGIKTEYDSFEGDKSSRGNKGVSRTVAMPNKKGVSARNIGTQNAIINELGQRVEDYDKVQGEATLKNATGKYRKNFIAKRAMMAKGLLGGVGGALTLGFLAKDIYDHINQ